MPRPVLISGPPPVWDYWLAFPNSYPGSNPAQNVQTYLVDSYPWQRQGTTSGSTVSSFDPGGGAGGTGIGDNFAFQSGQHCVAYSTTASIAQAFRPWILPFFKPIWRSGLVNPGYRIPPGFQVTVFDVAMIHSVVNAVHGFFFCPYSGAATPQPPLIAAGVGGFGIVGDGAGAFNFNTYANAGVLLHSVPLAVADNTKWSNFRLIIKSGDDASGALLSLLVDGTQYVTDLEFGGADLEAPDENVANAYTFCPMARIGNVAGTMYYRWAVKSGRFLPSGVPVATA